MQYRKVQLFMGNEVKCVSKIETDGSIKSIPFDPANTDYQAYLKWLDAGNTPEAADAAPAQEG